MKRKSSSTITRSRWLAYAAAGAATAGGTAPHVEAEIHYSGVLDYQFSGYANQTFPLDPKGGLLVFTHEPRYTYSTFTKFGGEAKVWVFASGGGSVNGHYKKCVYDPEVFSASNVRGGQSIASHPFVPYGGVLATGDGFACGGGPRGKFVGDLTGYIGFRFNNGGGPQYGWARLRFAGYPNNNYKLVDFAYADPGETIRAGQRTEGDAGVAQESLGALALGAAGVAALRRRTSRSSKR